MRTIAQTQPARASWRVKLGIWFALAAIIAGALAMMSTAAPLGGSGGMLASADHANVVAAGETYTAAPNLMLPAAGQELSEFYGTGKKDTMELLPAWRWQNASSLYVGVSWRNAGAQLMSILSTILFSLSAFLWSILLGVLRFGLTLNLVDSAASAINVGFVGLNRTIWASGLVFVLLAVGALTFAKFVLSGKGTKAITLAVAILLPLGAMQALATMATGTTESNTSPKGSPSWIAQEGVGALDAIGTGLGSGFGLLDGVSLRATGEEGAIDNRMSCYAYNQALYGQYNAYPTNSALRTTSSYAGDAAKAAREAGARLGTDAELKDQLNFRSGKSVASVSYLWERAYLNGWTNAQFGTSNDASNIACHKLEDGANIDPYEQQKIAIIAGYPAGVETKDGWRVFERNTKEDHESGMMAWAACTSTNGKDVVATEKWKLAEKSLDCNKWWTTGDLVNQLEWKDDNAILEATKYEGVTDAEQREDLADVRTTASSFKGYNGSVRLIGATLSAVTAVIYLYALGGIAVGAIIAQLGLVLLLILLPATLTLLAMPSKDGRNPAGKKLLRLTGSFMAAKLVLTVVMVLILQTIMTFEHLLLNVAFKNVQFGAALDGLLHAMIPLAALFLIRMLLKQIGLGDITKLSGSVGMQAAAAMNASGRGGKGGWNSNGASGISKAIGGNKTMDRMDRISSLRGLAGGAVAGAKMGSKTPSLLAAGTNGALKGAIAADNKLGGRAALAERAAGLVGRRDADGNLVEMGLGNRMRNKAGLLGLGAAGGALGMTPAALNSKYVKQAGEAIDRRRAQLGSARDISQNAREKRRAELQATRGMTARQRQEKRQQELNGSLAMTRAHAQAGTNDEVFMSPQGPMIQRRDKEGNDLGAPELVQNVWTPEQLKAQAIAATDKHNVKEEQLTLSGHGIGANITPQLTNGSGRASIPQAKSESATLAIAEDAIHYLPDHQKMRAPGMNDDEYGVYLELMRGLAGGIDPITNQRVNVLEAHGLEGEAARIELRKSARGERSALDDIKVEVSSQQHQAALSFVRSFRDSSNGAGYGSMGSELADVRKQLATAAAVELRDVERTALERTTNISSAKIDAEGIAWKVEQGRSQLNDAKGRIETFAPELVSSVEAVVRYSQYEAQSSDAGRKQEYAQTAAAAQAQVQAFTQSLEEKVRSIRSQIESAPAAQVDSLQNAHQQMVIQLEEAQTFASQAVALSLQEAQRDAYLTRLQDDAMALVEEMHDVRSKTAEANLTFDMVLVGKAKADAGEVIDKAVDMEDKILPKLKENMRKDVENAVAALNQARLNSDARQIHDALNKLNALVESNKSQMSSAVNDIYGKQASGIQALEERVLQAQQMTKHTETEALPRASAFFVR